MTKKQKQSQTKKARKKDSFPSSRPTPAPEEKTVSENPFDFGGLPQRDLKKNLGCG
jgi:hypothetical protein